MLDPNVGRVTITKHDDVVTITIPAKKNLFVAGFLGFWMIGWAFGWLMAVGALLSGTGFASIFLIGWLGAWTIGGIGAATVLLWNLRGFEIVTIDYRHTTVLRKIPLWSRKTVCETSQIRFLRVVENGAQDVRGRRNQIGMWSPRSAGSVRFDYGVHTVGFGIDLDRAEALRTVETLQKHVPAFQTAPPLADP